MAEKIQKRFIAGAVCTKCKQIDKIRAWSSQQGRHYECVYCDYQNLLPHKRKTAPENLIPHVRQE